MRVFVFVAIKLLLLEALLAFACYAGYYWLGGGWPGTLLVLAVAALIVAPWIGDLRVDFDSGAGKLRVGLAWWAAMQMSLKPPGEARFRVLFITWRSRGKAKPRRRRRAQAARPSGLSGVAQNLGGLARLAVAGLQALLTLLTEAKELRVRAQGLTQIDAADRALSGLVGAREVGSLDLTLLGSGRRKVEVHYRIGLLRACLAAEYALLEGRPLRTLRRLRAARQEAAAEAQAKESEG
jgi:hypothetical protein